MSTKNFDVGIIGAGVAGGFAAAKIAEKHKDVSTVIFDIGHRPGKRRRQLEGWLGAMPNGDGKLYKSDIEKLEFIDGRSLRSVEKWVTSSLSDFNKMHVIKDKLLADTKHKIENNGYKVIKNDYIQWYPEEIHNLSKYLADRIENSSNIHMSFDNEVHSIKIQKNKFIVSSQEDEFVCKKIILAAGRSGWRWSHGILNNLGLIKTNDVAKFGIKIELQAQHMKDFVNSNCSFYNDDVEIGPISWAGSIVPEDHVDVATAGFRSNEDRWKTDKVYFSLIGKRIFQNKGLEQTDRLAKLAFILSNDRIGKERIRSIIKKTNQLHLIPEYNWLDKEVNKLSNIIPSLITKGFFHIPAISTSIVDIDLSPHMESNIDGLYVVGESAGISGIYAAALTGAIAIEDVVKSTTNG